MGYVNVPRLINYDHAYQTQTTQTDSTRYADTALQTANAACSVHNVIQQIPEWPTAKATHPGQPTVV